MFENEEFSAPLFYDELLTKMYGDYMTPPPISEQKGHELSMGTIIFDTEKDYKYYRDEIISGKVR